MVRNIINLLYPQLPFQQRLVDNPQFVAHALGQKARQALVNNPFLLHVIAVPIDHLVAIALAATTNTVTYTGGTDTNTGGFDGGIQHATAVFQGTISGPRVYDITVVNARYKGLIHLS
jgi:hypothetical protein